MLPSNPIKFKDYNPEEHLDRYENRLPHWRQQGATYFSTFRLGDSIPKLVFETWELEKTEWLENRGVSIEKLKRRAITLNDVPEELRSDFEKRFNRKLQNFLDEGRGLCVLKDASVRNIMVTHLEIANALVGDFVIMPNHVHLLISSNGDSSDSIGKVMQKLKGASSREINEYLERRGKLWQKDSFDHLVRSSKQLGFFQSYIAENPIRAGLTESEFTHHSSIYDCT